MWFKVIGTSIILAAGFAAGEMMHQQWQKRIAIIQELLRFADYLRIELVYRERLLPDLLHEWQAQCRLAELQDYLAAWVAQQAGDSVALPEACKQLGLGEAEKHQLELLAQSLGQSLLVEQARLIEQFSEQMQRLLEERRKEGERRIGLWRYCGLFSAAILAVLLL